MRGENCSSREFFSPEDFLRHYMEQGLSSSTARW